MPKSTVFSPQNRENSIEYVTLTIDEYETIRLIDYVGLSQEECSDFMQVSRTTAQQIYSVARKKLAKMIVEATPLQIAGGSYQLCGGSCLEDGSKCPRCRCCHTEQEDSL